MSNRCVLSGRLTADPELRQTQNGISVASFTIAVDRQYTPKDGERQADFIDIVAWRGTAEFVSKYFTKGKWIEVDGSIQTRKYTDKSGNNRKAFEILADHVGFGGASKDAGSQANNGAAYSSPPPPAAPAGFDPFAGAAVAPPAGAAVVYPAPALVSAGGSDFAETDDDGDLPF